MILYDTFSVNIPVKNFKRSKIELDATVQRPREFMLTSATRDDASSSLHYKDCISTVHRLSSDGTKGSSIDAAVEHDDTKENLDPASRKFSRNDVTSNLSLMNDDTMTTDYDENDSQLHHILNGTNLNALSYRSCNTNVDSVRDSAGFIPNERDQDSRIDIVDTQHKKSTCGNSTPMEDRIGTRLFCKTMHSVDSDFNVNANKNVEKILQDDITVSIGQRVNNVENSSDHTDDFLQSNSVLYTTVSNRRTNNGYKNFDSANIARSMLDRDRAVISESNIKFNECNITNKQVDACDSKQFIRCTKLHENTVNTKTEDNSKCNKNSGLKVSIALRKLQNLIYTKPELFVSQQFTDDEQHRNKNQLHDDEKYIQQQVKYRDSETENSNSIQHSPSRNSESQISDVNGEQTQTRGIFSKANILDQCQKLKRRTDHFYKYILNR